MIARNVLWLDLMGKSSDRFEPTSVEHEFCDFSHTEDLFTSLKCGLRGAGAVHVSWISPLRAPGVGDACDHTEVRWHQLEIGHELPSLVMLVVKAGPAAERPKLIMAPPQRPIDRLLIRETLVQESERRRIGQALHDVVSQNLVVIRRELRSEAFSDRNITPLIERIDGVIASVRMLEFELCPPVLEDLGLCAALGWLSEHMGQRYGAHVTLARGSNEPSLSAASRTIVFRAVRELVLNAAKHINGATIVIGCEGDGPSTRITVSDTGPGFEIKPAHGESRFAGTYGLLSVEQQIRGIGGLFSLVSSVKDGTQALITIDAPTQKGD